jgi:hypothetical protein
VTARTFSVILLAYAASIFFISHFEVCVFVLCLTVYILLYLIYEQFHVFICDVSLLGLTEDADL